MICIDPVGGPAGGTFPSPGRPEGFREGHPAGPEREAVEFNNTTVGLGKLVTPGSESVNSNSVKLTFNLTQEQAGPFPVSTESLWCDCEGEYFRVKNIPFFLDELSYDDVISVTSLPDGNYRIESIVVPSDNSTLWIGVLDDDEGTRLVTEIKELGCGSESGVFNGYIAVNVPSVVDLRKVLAIVQQGEERGTLIVDYPSIRHETTE